MKQIDTDEKKDPGRSPRTTQGIVTARKCACCGHHEVGIVQTSGAFVTLQPGMVVAIISPQPPPGIDRPF